jgi:hypothetical protein
MVVGSQLVMFSFLAWPWAWSDAANTTESEVDAAYKAIILSAFVGLLFLGLLIIVIAWMGGRITRRYINRPLYRSGRTSNKDSLQDAWAEKPLIAPSEEDPDSFPEQ